MADVKHLTRDTPREEYFYRMGFQEGFKTARDSTGLDFKDNTENALAAVTQNAYHQIPTEPEVR